MLARLENFIAENGLLAGFGPVLVGVSGGLDSLTALRLLHELGWPLVCAHFDHRLRSESGREAEFVARAAGELGIPFVCGSGDVLSYRTAGSLSVEEASRQLRYAFLFDQARQAGARAVVTGHTADDQVETVLMHFLRGAGTVGLRGMRPRTILAAFDPHIPIVRPLVSSWKSELAAYRLSRGSYEILDDPTNQDPAFLRNRIRHALLPILEAYNPKIREAVLRNAAALAADDEFLSTLADDAWESAAALDGAAVRIDPEKFSDLPRSLQARLLRRAAAELLPDLGDLDQAALVRVSALLAAGGERAECDLAGGLRLMLEGRNAWIASGWDALPLWQWPQLAGGGSLLLPVPGRLELPDDWVLTANIFDRLPDDWRAGAGGHYAWADADRLVFPLRVRGRLPGERFAPQGLAEGTVLLSDFMINEKIPKRARARWPLVVSGDRIVWVAGRRPSRDFEVHAATRRFLLLTLDNTAGAA